MLKSAKETGGAVSDLSDSVVTTTGTARRISDAIQMVEAFESLGVTEFDVTLTDEHRRKKAFAESRPSSGLRDAIASGYLYKCEDKRQNIIIRPIVTRPCLVQLDDLLKEKADALEELAFLIIETSAENYQVWIAVEHIDEDAARELKRFIGADINASGAVRLAGSKNFKERHAPDYPIVRLHSVAPGRIVTVSEMVGLGFLSAPTPASELPPCAPRSSSWSRTWPDYGKCLAAAPPANTHRGPDRSEADYRFALYSLSRGFTEEEVIEALYAKSEKAKEKGGSGRRYCEYTVRSAAKTVAEGKAR